MSEAHQFEVVAPSVVQVNERFAVGVKAIGAYAPVRGHASWKNKSPQHHSPFNVSPLGIVYRDNVPSQWQGAVRFTGDDDYRGPSAQRATTELVSDGRPVARIEGHRFTKPGFKFIYVDDPVNGIQGCSNPIYVSIHKPDLRLFWGDLHVHTCFTDGIRNPEELYNFARDEAFLDVCALTDHAEGLTDHQWRYFSDVTHGYNRAHRFVTLVGGEWTAHEFGLGHRNYYYGHDNGPPLRSTDPHCKTLEEFYTACRRHRALVIPHHSLHPQLGSEWSQGHAVDLERLVEVYSNWGSSEHAGPTSDRVYGDNSVIEALNRGYRFGMIGSSDAHDGRPGDSCHTSRGHLDAQNNLIRNKQGLVGIWAEELTREAIFKALWERCVYATTNTRAVLCFRINGLPMGSTVTTESDDFTIDIQVASAVPVCRVELVHGGHVVHEYKPNRRVVDWSATLPACKGWYYVRVTQNDGNRAWSSPIWVRA